MTMKIFALLPGLALPAALAGQAGDAPAADHHLHLLSPAIVEQFAAPPLVPVELPPELDRVLRERERIVGTADTADVFTDDAQLVDNGETTWSRGRQAVHATVSRQRPGYRIVPLGYEMEGASAYVTAAARRGEGSAARYTANVLFALRRGDDGVWRIAAENASVKNPPRFNAPFLADSLVRLLDGAGIRRGVVLSLAYIFGSPLGPRGADEYDRVRAENDWTAQQVGRFPDRLVGFCSLNPLREYALGELERCARDPRLRGLKLHFGNSAVDVRNPEHVRAVRGVFQAANQARIPIIVHLWTLDPSYGREHSEIFLDQIVPAAPDIPIQIAHMGASGPGYHADEAVGVLADAAEAGDPRVRNLWFDVATLVSGDLSDAQVETVTRRLRQLGVERLLFGSDLDPAVPPRRAWATFRVMLPLTDAELRAIADNVAPYLR